MSGGLITLPSAPVAPPPGPAGSPGKYRPPGLAFNRELYAVLAIAQRDVVKLRRDHWRLAVSLVFPVMLVVGLGYVLEPNTGEASSADALGLAFSGVLAATLFQSAAAGMVSIVEDRENDFARQLFVAPIARLSLVSGKVAGEVLVALVEGTLLVGLALVFGVHAAPLQLLFLVGPCVACCVLGAAFGLATVAALPNQRSAMQVFQFLIIPQYVLSGLLVPRHNLPAALSALAWAMPMRYAVDLVRSAYYAGNPHYASVVTLSPVWDSAVLLALCAGFMLAGATIFQHRERRK